MLQLVLGHGAFDSVWMMAFQHDTMADPKVFSAAIVSSLTALRKMPQFSTPPEKDSKHFGLSTLTPLGEVKIAPLCVGFDFREDAYEIITFGSASHTRGASARARLRLALSRSARARALSLEERNGVRVDGTFRAN